MIKKLVFSECEYEGDLETYVWEAVNSDGKVVGIRWDRKRRMGTIEIAVSDKRDFEKWIVRFKSKSSYSFLRNP